MHSPAKQHKQAVLSRKSLADTGTTEGLGSAYDLLNLKMVEDKRALKTIQSIKAKIEQKRTMLPHYADWVDATLEHGKGKPDALLATLMVWHIDVGDFERGLDIAEYMLKHNMTMSDTHQRTTATVIAEEVADTAKSLVSDGTEFDVAQVLRASTMTAEHDMPDQVRAKIARMVGELTEESDPESALEHYKMALSYDEKAGVKGSIKRLEKTLASDNGSDSADDAGDADDADESDDANTES